eukprot:tig00000692_g3253.t1
MAFVGSAASAAATAQRRYAQALQGVKREFCSLRTQLQPNLCGAPLRSPRTRACSGKIFQAIRWSAAYDPDEQPIVHIHADIPDSVERFFTAHHEERSVSPEIALDLSKKLTRLARQLRDDLLAEEKKERDAEIWVGDVSPGIAYSHNPSDDQPDSHIRGVAAALESLAASLYTASQEGGQLPPLEELVAPPSPAPQPAAAGALAGVWRSLQAIVGRGEEAVRAGAGAVHVDVMEDARLLEVVENVGGADEEIFGPEYDDYGEDTTPSLHDPGLGITSGEVLHGDFAPGGSDRDDRPA